jgi:hypothetical protein
VARIRTIKPEFFTSEDIVELSPLARLLYIAIWCEADKEGRLSWKPKTFKMRYFPADDCNIDAMCDELVTRSLCVLYGDSLAFIPTFKEHQHINPREKESALPSPLPQKGIDASPRVTDEPVTVITRAGRKEGKGREHTPAIPPDGFSEFWDAYGKKKGKEAAIREWRKICPDDELIPVIVAAATTVCAVTEERFRKDPERWIKGRHWTDEIATPSQINGKPTLPEWMRGAL